MNSNYNDAMNAKLNPQEFNLHNLRLFGNELWKFEVERPLAMAATQIVAAMLKYSCTNRTVVSKIRLIIFQQIDDILIRRIFHSFIALKCFQINFRIVENSETENNIPLMANILLNFPKTLRSLCQSERGTLSSAPQAGFACLLDFPTKVPFN